MLHPCPRGLSLAWNPWILGGDIQSYVILADGDGSLIDLAGGSDYPGIGRATDSTLPA
jgi:hypothetical protein